MERNYPNHYFSTFKYYHITKNTLPDFNKMSIVDLCFDKNYMHFLVVKFQSDDVQVNQKIVIYDKPFIRPNSETSLIGHVI
jgi:hypothetical protein